MKAHQVCGDRVTEQLMITELVLLLQLILTTPVIQSLISPRVDRLIAHLLAHLRLNQTFLHPA
jgi:hypothetical protein